VSRLDGQGRQQSLTSEMKLPAESDTESIADYADGNDGGKVHVMVICIKRDRFRIPNQGLNMYILSDTYICSVVVESLCAIVRRTVMLI
jgi:hypothetical protein